MAQPLWALPAFLLGHAAPVLPTGTPRQPDASPGYLCLQSSLPLHASASSFLPATSRLVPSSQELVPGVQLSRRRASPGLWGSAGLDAGTKAGGEPDAFIPAPRHHLGTLRRNSDINGGVSLLPGRGGEWEGGSAEGRQPRGSRHVAWALVPKPASRPQKRQLPQFSR